MRLLTLLSLFFLGFISSLCAEANWYLIGGLRGELETFFENHPEVELIWGFEEGTAKWASKKESIESKLSQFTKLEQLDECGGYWVLSTKRPEYFPFNQCTYAELVYPGFKLLKGNGTSVKSFLTENPEVDMIWSYTDPTPTSYRQIGRAHV